MKHNIIKTENYLLVVDDKKTIENWYYNESEGKVDSIEFTPNVIGGTIIHNIKAHLPLNNSPILEGVDLLPPIEDDVKLDPKLIDSMAMRYRHDFGLLDKQHKDSIRTTMVQLWEEVVGKGFYKAKEKYKYTEEDMRKAIEMARNGKRKATDTKGAEYLFSLQEDEIIQSFKQPKLPVAFNCEMKQKSVNGSIPVNQEWEYEPKTTTNSQGQTQWVGSYIYE
jgi:hypothetical protein